MSGTLLELKNVVKTYPGVRALAGVDFSVEAGEIHALVGENGAGKSTLIKIITGAIPATEGSIVFDGKPIRHNSPELSLSLGIAAIYQEFNLVPKMTVAENIFIGRYPSRRGLVKVPEMRAEARRILDELGMDIDVDARVETLTVGYQQLVEIAKSVSRNVRLLIMDEPSAPLTNNELAYLFRIVARLKAGGVSILYISHRLEEIFSLCDRVTVFRDGRSIATTPVASTNRESLIRMMVDRALDDSFPPSKKKAGGTVLEVRNLSTVKVKNISFQVRAGEILGFAGLVGAGRTEVARAVFGADRRLSGDILVKGKPVRIQAPSDAISAGIGLIPEDRKLHGALLHLSVKDNATYASLGKLFPSGVLIPDRERSEAGRFVDLLRIKTPSIEQLVRNLSGGNQQKVVLAKWLMKKCEILFFDEPTRGIDVGAKREIYELMREFAAQGMAIIMISSEMPELLGMSDRILVLHEGEIAGEVSQGTATQERILALASGETDASTTQRKTEA